MWWAIDWRKSVESTVGKVKQKRVRNKDGNGFRWKNPRSIEWTATDAVGWHGYRFWEPFRRNESCSAEEGLTPKDEYLMRRSKLEMYVDILQVLSMKGPLKLTHIMYKANVNCSVLKEYLDFLIKQSLVAERIVGKGRVVYAITERGSVVMKQFKELKQVLPIVEEARTFSPYSF